MPNLIQKKDINVSSNLNAPNAMRLKFMSCNKNVFALPVMRI